MCSVGYDIGGDKFTLMIGGVAFENLPKDGEEDKEMRRFKVDPKHTKQYM